MAGVGLVSYETSVPNGRIGPFAVDTARGRLRRLRHTLTTASRLHSECADTCRREWSAWMVTLTYAQPDAWEPGHITGAIRTFGKRLKRRGFPFRYVWVSEIQPQRLARTGHAVVHYHLVLWLPVGVHPGRWDQDGFWPHGLTQSKRVFAPVKYVMKYASKGSSEAALFPKGARIFGVGGLDTWAKEELRWWKAPKWLRAMCGIQDRPKRRVGGGWLIQSTGEVIDTPYEVLGIIEGFVWMVEGAGNPLKSLWGFR